MAKKVTKIYCVYCGTENKEEDEFCSKCKKNLHPKNKLFKDFLYAHIKDELKDNLTDHIFSYLKNYIISNLYGIAMSIAIIFTAVATISNLTGKYHTVTDISEAKLKSNGNEVKIIVYTYDDYCSDIYDPVLAGVPFAVAGAVVTGQRRTIQEITIKKGTSINDYCKTGHETELICAEQLAPYKKYKNDLDKSAKKYRQKILEYAAWVSETGAKDDEEYMRRNFEIEDLEIDLFPEDLTEFDKNKAVKETTELFISEVGCSYEEVE